MSQIFCLNIINYYSTLKYLSFKVLHDHISQNHDFTHFRGAPIFGGLEKGVRGVKKIGRQNFCVLYILRGLQTKNQKIAMTFDVLHNHIRQNLNIPVFGNFSISMGVGNGCWGPIKG